MQQRHGTCFSGLPILLMYVLEQFQTYANLTSKSDGLRVPWAKKMYSNRQRTYRGKWQIVSFAVSPKWPFKTEMLIDRFKSMWLDKSVQPQRQEDL
jgi:hypothetical protein